MRFLNKSKKGSEENKEQDKKAMKWDEYVKEKKKQFVKKAKEKGKLIEVIQE